MGSVCLYNSFRKSYRTFDIDSNLKNKRFQFSCLIGLLHLGLTFCCLAEDSGNDCHIHTTPAKALYVQRTFVLHFYFSCTKSINSGAKDRAIG